MKKILCTFLTALLMLSVLTAGISLGAARDLSKETAVAEDLKSLGLFKGVSDTDFALERPASRVEALVMLIRMLGKETEALATTKTHPFKDVPAWADKYVAYAYAEGLTKGISATEFGSSDANATQYLTFVLRALGYSDTNGADFTWDNPFDLAKKTGILTSDVVTDSFLRADVALVSKNALSATLKGTTTTLASKLISEGVFTEDAFNKVMGTPDKPMNTVSTDKFAGKTYLDVSQYPDPYIISFKSLEHLESNSELYYHKADPKEHGTYEFVEGALRLTYNEPAGDWQGQYRVMFQPETVNMLNSAHTIIQVVYRTDADSGELRFNNNGAANDWVVLESDVSKSQGEWRRSELMELSAATIKRLSTRMPVTVCLHTTDKDAYVEIREIRIFCSPEQAMLYAKEEDGMTEATQSVYNLTSAAKMLQSGVKFYDHGESNPTEEGVFEFTEVDGEKALRLYYSDHKWAGVYRVMFRPHSEIYSKKFSESDTWYVRVRYKTDAACYSKLTLINNKDASSITLATDFVSSGDNWCVTEPIQMPAAFAERLASGMWLSLGFHFYDQNVKVYVSDIAFFPTYEAACDYYGDAADVATGGAAVDTMKIGGTGASVRASDPTLDTEGYWESDPDTGAAIIKYSPSDKHNWGNYRLMPMFSTVTQAMTEAKYFRIIYKAENPAGAKNVALKVTSNGVQSQLIVDDDVQNTNGQWVASQPQMISPVIHDRWFKIDKPMHCTVGFYAPSGGSYAIREIVFFKSLEAAMAYELKATDNVEINIAGTPIDQYVIVMSENPGRRTQNAVNILKNHIRSITGKSLEVITDAEPQRTYEIVVGNTTRPAAAPYYSVENGKYVTGEYSAEICQVTMSGNTLLILGGSEITIEEGMNSFLEIFLGYGASTLPSKFDLRADTNYVVMASLYKHSIKWDDPAPVADPIVFTDNFDDETISASPDYWIEAYDTDNWHITTDGANKFYSTDADAFTYTRLHVYERDIDYTAKMRFDKLSADSDAGLLARYNHAGAYIRVGYADGKWYLRTSEGPEFNVYTLDTAKTDVKADTWYTIRLTVQKNEVKVYIDGVLTLETSYVSHLSPGPMGMFAEKAAVSFDDVSVTLVSGQGRVMKGVVDSTFWTGDGGLCSGSVFEMKDGKLRYIHSNEGAQRISTDGGLTWKTEKFTDVTTDCVNIYRLNSGNLIKMMEETIGGVLYHVTYTSTDEGVTWTRGGKLAAHDYKGYGTMIQTIENDKFFQASNGRLFVSQNYQGSIPKGEPNDHMKVFNEMWYSDDEGKTWTQSKTSSYDMTNSTHIGESKVIETADGALLWITPWNNLGYIIAAESKDNGETFGKFYNITTLPCAISSFGIMRDEHAENNTTYYLSWVYNESSTTTMPRSRLCLAMTTDGRNWTFLGDVYRWECNYMNSTGALVNHIVDPFLTVTKDYIFVGSGFSAHRAYSGNNGFHNVQQQKVFRIEKSALVPYESFPQY